MSSLKSSTAIFGNIGSVVANPIIDKYRQAGLFRSLVKQVLTGDASQICPTAFLHGPDCSCSAVISKVAQRKPQHLITALIVQKKRCKDAAIQILENSDTRDEYNRKKGKQRNGSGNTTNRKSDCVPDCGSAFLIGDVVDCIPTGRKGPDCDLPSPKSCDAPDCHVPDCDISCH